MELRMKGREKHITKNDLYYVYCVLNWEKTDDNVNLHYVEFEVINPERFDKLAKNLYRCAPANDWTEKDWNDLLDEKGEIMNG